MKRKNKKLKVGIFGVSGCAGCLLSVLYEDTFKRFMEIFDMKAFPLIKEDKYKGDFDLIFVEGTVCFNKDIISLNELRARTKCLVALGSCACFGGVPSIKNFHDGEKIMRLVYPKHNHLRSEKPTPLSNHVKVDFYLPQCPPSKEEILEFVISIAEGDVFRSYKNPVCIECRKAGNLCLLQEGKVCLGPVALGGCRAICPSNGVGCYGCRGPSKDANYKSFIDILRRKGHTKIEIEDKMETFAGLAFKEEEGRVSKWLEK